MQPATQGVIVHPGQSMELRAFGDVVSVLLGGEQTGGHLMVAFDTTPAGGGPPPHIHANENELFLVVEGRVRFFVDGSATDVEADGAVYLPRGSRHY